MLVASPHCGHVLGKGGSYVKELRNTYGGHVGFSGTDQFFPGTSERICLITGTIEQVSDLSCQVLERVWYILFCSLLFMDLRLKAFPVLGSP